MNVMNKLRKALSKMGAIPPSQYQSFEPGAGSSDSFGKLEALKLPDMAGKRFLDLGCNHGFFCFAALERGASEVVGVDRDPKAIEAATARARHLGVEDKARFLNLSWDDFHEDDFDVVILLSALHYAKDQQAMLAKIAGLLKPDGLFVLEGGAIANPKNNWTSIIRGRPPHTDMVEYPTPRHMFDMLSEHFAPRDKGKSVMQPGDMIPRHVWHCPKLRRMLLTIGAPSNYGKTTFAFTLQSKGIPLIDVDVLLGSEKQKDTPLGRCIASVYKVGELHRCYEKIAADGLWGDLARVTVANAASIPPREKTIAIMSSAFTDSDFRLEFDRAAGEQFFTVWSAERTT